MTLLAGVSKFTFLNNKYCMKKILSILLLSSFGVLAQAQTIDSTACGYAVRIQPVQVKYYDTASAVYLKAAIVGDDMVSSCSFYYQLLGPDCTVLGQGNVIIDGQKYQDWEGSSEEAYRLIAEAIKVSIIE